MLRRLYGRRYAADVPSEKLYGTKISVPNKYETEVLGASVSQSQSRSVHRSGLMTEISGAIPRNGTSSRLTKLWSIYYHHCFSLFSLVARTRFLEKGERIFLCFFVDFRYVRSLYVASLASSSVPAVAEGILLRTL